MKSAEKPITCYTFYMPDITAPETTESKPIPVPKEASQLFGAYLRQEFKEGLEAIGKPETQRLTNFIDDLEWSKEVKLAGDGFLTFEFSKEKDQVLTANSFTMGTDLTPRFLSAIDHNVRNALFELVKFDEKIPFKMADVLDVLSKAEELQMSRDESGKIKVIPLSQMPIIT